MICSAFHFGNMLMSINFGMSLPQCCVTPSLTCLFIKKEEQMSSLTFPLFKSVLFISSILSVLSVCVCACVCTLWIKMLIPSIHPSCLSSQRSLRSWQLLCRRKTRWHLSCTCVTLPSNSSLKTAPSCPGCTLAGPGSRPAAAALWSEVLGGSEVAFDWLLGGNRRTLQTAECRTCNPEDTRAALKGWTDVVFVFMVGVMMRGLKVVWKYISALNSSQTEFTWDVSSR